MQQNKPISGITFVSEFHTFAKNFSKNKDGVAAIDVSSCILLELNNRDDNKRTAFSLTHFIAEQLEFPGIIPENLDLIIKNFQSKGGVFDKNTQIRLYGGMEEMTELRENIKNAITAYAKQHHGIDVEILEPKGHCVSRNDSYTIGYLFEESSLKFCKEDASKSDQDKDRCTYSNNLSNEGLQQEFNYNVFHNYNKVEAEIENQKKARYNILNPIYTAYHKAGGFEKAELMKGLMPALIVSIVDDCGMVIQNSQQTPKALQ